MNSLERRLQVWLAATLLLLMGLLWIVGNQSIRALTEDFVVSRLEHDAESLLAALDFDRGGTRLRWRRINQIYSQPLSGHYYVILLGDGEPIFSRSLWDHSLDIPMLAPGESRQLRLLGPDGQQLLLLVKGFRKQGRELTLAVAEDMTLIKERRDRFKRDFGLFALVGILGLLLLQSVVIRRAFKRLQPLRKDILRLEQGETGSLSEDVPSEILPLVREFNSLVQLLAQRLKRSRNALGNLTHALKGPLNILTQYFDGLERGGGPQPEEAKAQAERIGQLMDRELRRARLAGSGLQSRRFNPRQELPELIGLLKQMYPDKNLDIQWLVAESITPFGDREDMLELLGNLLDNACKWAASEITCEFRGDAEIEIIVADDGQGISDDELGSLAERGVRLDESIEGHGLGLAIARDIVNLYGGELAFSRSVELGGLQVAVRLLCREAED
jgi:signal transduction histidine kinase